MDEELDDPSFQPDDGHGSKKKAGFKPSSMVSIQPCEDLQRYTVDKFHSSTRSKTVLFEKIDLAAYKSSAKVASFLTSEERLPLWIKTFMIRYFSHLNTMGYRVTWQEQESYSCPTKSDKIILHIYDVENSDEDQLVTISIFISTGRIMIQGKKFAEWSRDEFPTLLSIVNNLEPLGNPSSQNPSLFLMALPNLFPKCQGIETNKEEINETNNEEDAVRDNEILDVTATHVNKGTTETRQMSEHIEPLSLTPTRLNTLVTLRNTVGNLEAEFTQFKITQSGNIEHLKDKAVQQDHLLKVQKTTLGGLADDLANTNKQLNDELQKHTALITKLQDENHALQKKNAKISEENSAMKQNQNHLEAEVTFLKDQIKSLWEKLNSPEITSSNPSSQPPPNTVEENTISGTDEERDKEYENPSPKCDQWNENELLVVNLPTSNPFSPLQEPPTKPIANGKQALGQDTQNTATPASTTSNNNNNNTRSNEAIFLCDSNGKFLDTKQMFSSKLEVKYIRTPLIEHARSYMQKIRTPPQMILLHTGTNDLETANSAEELISNILMLITEASTKFPSSKILFSTLLPRNDIPTPLITSINDQLISNCSRLPNVQLIKHDNLFANQPNILYDHKHILKRHIGLFAKNLKDAIHGRAQRRTPRNHPASPQGGSPLLHHTSFSNTIKNTPSHTYHWPNDPQTRPQAMPLVKPRLQQQVTPAPQQAAPNQTLAAPHQYPNAPHQTLPHAGKMETAREETHPSSSVTNTIPQEIISFLRFVKSFV